MSEYLPPLTCAASGMTEYPGMPVYPPLSPSDREGGFVGFTILASFLGMSLAWIECLRTVNDLIKFRDTPSVRVSGLRSLLDDDGCCGRESLVMIRGKPVVRRVVKITSTRSMNQGTEIEKVNTILGLRAIEAYINLMMNQGTEDEKLMNLRTENEKVNAILPFRGIEAYCNLMMLGHHSGDANEFLHGIRGALEESGCKVSVELVPFAFVDGDHCVYCNVQKTQHPPYIRGDSSMTTMEYSPYPFTSPSDDFKDLAAAWNRHRLFLIEKEFTAVGTCRKRGGHLEIEPDFMCGMTKDEIVEYRTRISRDYFWLGIVSGLFAFTTLGYAVLRYSD